ncbi:MAG: DNA polymerase I [Patescibacteria group bacterium]
MPKPPEKNFKRYMLVDGNALIHRAFHAIPNLSTKAGEPTNAVYGFSVILLKALKDIKPTHIALTFDLAGPTFRHDKYKEYKATRVKAADELYAQIPRCKEVVADLGIPIYEQSGFEADDMLGTLAEHIKHSNNDHKHFEVIIVTGDLDTLQLVDEHVKVYTLRKGVTDTIIYDPAAVFERYGIKPTQMVDFKAIKGDPSDNIPGVKGIGEKGALDLIKEYGSIEKIYANLDKLKEKTKKLFEEQKEQVELSLWLSQIIKDVKIEYNIPEYEFSQINYGKIVELFQKLEFRTLIPKLPQILGNKEVSVEEAQKIQPKSNDNYELIDTEEKLKDLATQLSKQEEFVFDTETEGLGALDFNLVGISFCFKEGHAYYLPVEVLSSSKNKEIQKIFADEKIKKIGHNIKYDYLALKKYGIEVNNLFFDTMIASYLLAPGSRSHDLDSLAFNEFGYQMQPIEELIGKGKKQISMKDVPKEKVCFYAAEDADYTFRLKQKLLPQLKKEELDKIFFDIEMPLTKVLAEMEENGVLLDIPLFKKLEKEVQSDLQKLETKIYKEAHEEFNINSPAQLKVILFQKLSIPIGGEGMFVKKTKTGYSTAASELEKMKGLHPIIDMILEYRELSKLQSTYVKALPELVSKRDHRLHTSYNQTITATGRISSSNPNLQNIPAGSTGYAAEIRKGFLAAPGTKLVSIDYSQIELRVVAHLSGDKTMTEVFKKGEDIHTATAMQLYGIDDPSKVTKEMRRDAKTINFGVLYGLSSFGLSERVDMTRAEATEFIKKYFKAFSAVDTYLKQVVTETRTNGYTHNELGRKRYFPEINSSQFQVRAAAERAAINMPMQSLAADIFKISMNKIEEAIGIQKEDIKLLLQVHDELVFEIQETEVKKYAEKIKEIMENAYKLKVPLVVDVKVGDDWGEMKELGI